MKLSVIVPAFNEEKLITSCLVSIRAATAACEREGLEVEIIVVDNASSDDTARLAARRGARVVREPVRQIARARNAGAAVARGDWLLFVDADSWPSRALMREVFACMHDARIVGGGSTVRVRDVPLALTLVGVSWNALSRLCRWAAGSFIFCRATAFNAIGGFDVEFFAAEEIDFSRRLKRWARSRGQRFVILHRHPLLTSERRATLYSQRELFVSFWRMLRHPRRFFRDPRLCHPWYDGRR
ncbi:MAG: glycosyltransferase [Gammaproteobacteria bacterium]|nr:glycosyltransferase [Gammaproteobacteria bacterium]NIR82077.1 glycosyltransferase [Gammaproteobacteria bacterium]NIR89310.1 glycosyltransferase [Gammaproteobacteria bacterium]NIU03187.1 glycosyltransferase [Gammaproteobacteria bacterium]NIV74475.1 glycosyltransferase [Gammaproteobacteria bacterium]